jgi:alanine racemase
LINFGSSPHVEISLDNLLHNLKQIQSIANPHGNDIMAVVKDNAYGCGAVAIASTLEKHGGVRFFTVARFQEACKLRDSGITSPILVLGKPTIDQIKDGWNKRIIFTLNDLSDLKDWISNQLEIRFHLNIDTGMGRLGLLPSEIATFCEQLKFRSEFTLKVYLPTWPALMNPRLFRLTISYRSYVRPYPTSVSRVEPSAYPFRKQCYADALRYKGIHSGKTRYRSLWM